MPGQTDFIAKFYIAVHKHFRTIAGTWLGQQGQCRKNTLTELETRSARLRLPSEETLFIKLARGLALGYRRTKTAALGSEGDTRWPPEWTDKIGTQTTTRGRPLAF